MCSLTESVLFKTCSQTEQVLVYHRFNKPCRRFRLAAAVLPVSLRPSNRCLLQLEVRVCWVFIFKVTEPSPLQSRLAAALLFSSTNAGPQTIQVFWVIEHILVITVQDLRLFKSFE